MKTKQELREFYSQLRRAGRLHGTIKRAMQLRLERDGRKTSITRPRTELIPLPLDVRTELEAWARHAYPQRRNWECGGPSRKLGRVVTTTYHGRYSSSCTYERLSYTPYTRSCGTCSKRTLLWFLESDTLRLRAPAGFQWGRDSIGLYIVRDRLSSNPRFRYHFWGSDLENLRCLRTKSIKHEREVRETLARERKRAREKAAAERERTRRRNRALRLGVFVGMEDSRRAGNCAAGTIRWGEQHNLDHRRHYRLEVIQRLGERNGHAQQVSAAIDAAIERTLLDAERGYCVVRYT